MFQKQFAKKSMASLIGIVSTATFGLLCFIFGMRFAERDIEGHVRYVNSQNALFQFDGNDIEVDDLNKDETQKLKEISAKEMDRIFTVQYDTYRQRDRFLKNIFVNHFYRDEKNSEPKAHELSAAQVLQTMPVTHQDAMALYLASDPSAPLKDFATIEPQLTAYLEEVRQREAIDKLVDRLVEEGRLRFFNPRPFPHALDVKTEGFPTLGNLHADKVVISFVDYFCENCPNFNLKLSQILNSFESRAQFVFIPFPYTRPEKGLAFARGALCASQQKRFIDFHMAAIAQGDVLEKTTPRDIAADAKLDSKEFEKCYQGGKGLAQLLAAAQSEANRAGVIKTPAVIFSGELHDTSDSLVALQNFFR